MTAPFSMSLVACGLGDFSIMKSLLERFFMVETFSAPNFYIPLLFPYRFEELTNAGQYARAAELMAAFLEYPFSFAGVRYSMAWATRWGWFARLRAEVEAALGETDFRAAWERGKALTLDDLDAELRPLLNH
jgi:hypothetical protein